ncbi:NAD(P)H-binding protein [Parasphingorhabdus sp.]|uniref:NAD(P)H-binding protein n=1 Tax=Parasphingorhabdus sp. TaxID=2709688 RepID=UPI0007F4D767|nr:NmrA family transcriptional regulator [Sphingomonadales bacterium EhC05]
MQVQHHEKNITLVLGGTGKTGRRIAERLKQKGKVVRIGSRSAVPAFDWNNEKTWQAAIDGVSNIYISYTPDLAMPGAGDAISALVQQARNAGAKRLILLSGRGEDEAQACEAIVQNSGLDWTIVRASWFNQNFSEGAFIDMVSNGAITLPAGDTLEPFIDADDIADVAVAALTEDGHAGQVYEVTGPRLMTFADIAKALSQATGREINYTNVPHDDFIEGIRQSGAPQDVVWMLDYLFATVLDGRNAHVAYGVVKAIGRPAKDFADYARDAAASGCWEAA